MEPMELTCFEVVAGHVELRPAPRRRPWMDATPRAFAYHCLPLVIGNLHAWEMLCPFAFEATWHGGPTAADLELVADPATVAAHAPFVASHFGSGILSFSPLVILRTAPGWNLWITGPTNHIKDGIQALDAAIEADWMPFTFAMNWKLTRPGLTVRFEQGEPFCAFFPMPRGALSACTPRLAALADDPALAAAYHHAVQRRDHDERLSTAERDVYQRWYTAGEQPDRAQGRGPDDHEVQLGLKPFIR
jgi:hypothetical protein